MERYIAIFYDPVSMIPNAANYVRIDAPDFDAAVATAEEVEGDRTLVDVIEADEFVRLATDWATERADYIHRNSR